MSVQFEIDGERNPLELLVRLKAGGCEHDVRVNDISGSGAKLECVNPPAAGTLVTLIVGTDHLPARVAWSAGTSMGLQFIEPSKTLQES